MKASRRLHSVHDTLLGLVVVLVIIVSCLLSLVDVAQLYATDYSSSLM